MPTKNQTLMAPALLYLMQQNADDYVNVDALQKELNQKLNPYRVDEFNDLIASENIKTLQDFNQDDFFEDLFEDIGDACDQCDFEAIKIIAQSGIDIKNQFKQANHALYYDDGELTPMLNMQLIRCLKRLSDQ